MSKEKTKIRAQQNFFYSVYFLNGNIQQCWGWEDFLFFLFVGCEKKNKFILADNRNKQHQIFDLSMMNKFQFVI